MAIQCGLLLMKNETEQTSKLFEALPSQTKVISGAWKLENLFFISKQLQIPMKHCPQW